MNQEKEQLAKAIASLHAAKEEISKIFWDREVNVQKKVDVIEKSVQEFNMIVNNIASISASALNLAKYLISFNPNAVKSEEILNVQLRDVINNFTLLRDVITKELNEKAILLHDRNLELAQISEIVDDKKSEVELLDSKISKLTHQYSATKEENKKSEDEISQLQDEMTRIKSEINASFLTAQQALQRMTINHDQLSAKINEDNEKTSRDLFKVLDVLIDFKTCVEVSLNEVNQCYQKEFQ